MSRLHAGIGKTGTGQVHCVPDSVKKREANLVSARPSLQVGLAGAGTYNQPVDRYLYSVYKSTGHTILRAFLLRRAHQRPTGFSLPRTRPPPLVCSHRPVGSTDDSFFLFSLPRRHPHWFFFFFPAFSLPHLFNTHSLYT